MSTTTLTAPGTDVIGFGQFNPADASDSSALKFVRFYLSNPGDALSKAFTNVITSKSTTLAADVAAFFSAYPAYSACTLDSYLAAMIYQAQQPASVSAPVAQKTYSLNTIISLLGGQWPSGMPDIALANPSCSFSDGTLDISFELDFTTLSFENAIVAGNVRKLVTDTSVQATLITNFQPASNLFETKISIQLEDVKLPVSPSDAITIQAPTVSLDFTPAFKYVVFTLTGDMPVTIFNTPLDVDLSLVIDNDEAAIGASITGNNASLPAPPGVKGLHFDEIGIGMGLFFEPPGFAFGFEGKFHIGDTANPVVDLDDDTFALVCEWVEEAITPKYLGFYVPKMDINTALELFTNTSPNVNVPVTFSDLSFHWASGINDAIALPDGTLSPSGYGFSAAVTIFSFGFYGEMNLDETTGLSADVELSPIALGNLFQLTGDGQGYSIKIDAAGNPIKNNFVPTTGAEQAAIANATTKQIVAPGGAALVINTVSLPFLHLNAKASLFELVKCDIAADVNQSGITFQLDYGAVLKTKVSVTLSDFHNLAASFTYGINQTISVPHLGSFQLVADVNTHFGIAATLSNVKLSVGGGFNFWGLSRSFGDFGADINISKMSDLLAAIGAYIEQEARQIFGDILADAQKWAEYVKNGFLKGCDEVGTVLKNVWNESSVAVAQIMKQAGYAIDDITRNIKDAWNCGAADVTAALKAVGYTADEVAVSLKNVYNAASNDVASALKAAGYTAQEVGQAIKDTWNCGINDVSWAMQQAGYGIDDMASTLKAVFSAGAQDVANALALLSIPVDAISKGLLDVFNIASQDLAGVLKNLGCDFEDVAGAIRDTWNCGINDVTWAMQQVGYAAGDIALGLKSAFNAAAGDVATAFKQFGIDAQDAANAIKGVYNLAINDVASALKQAGYAIADVASALKNAFNTTVEAVANVMKQVGYAAADVKNAFDSLGGDFKSFADTAWSDTKYYLNPSHW